MNKLVLFVLTIILLVPVLGLCADKYSSHYEVIFDYAYNSGYEGGKQEKEEGYDYEPEVVLAQPAFQLLMKTVRESLIDKGVSTSVFNQAFRDGFIAGYKDGYYGYRKRKTKYDK